MNGSGCFVDYEDAQVERKESFNRLEVVLCLQHQKARRGHHRCCNDDGMRYELPVYGQKSFRYL